jgi:site-specific DNA recombinase
VLLDDLLPVVRIFPAGSNPPPPVPVYVHVYDWRGRLRPLPIGPEEAATYERQVAHAKRYGGIID